MITVKISKELLKGSSAILVLSVLKNKDLYGYKIIREIEIRSDNTFSMSEGSLYPVLHALEKEKYLVSYWEEHDGRNRKYYHLTKNGLKLLESKKEEWKLYSSSVNKVLSFS